jgi:hypothetical protein
MKTLAALTLLLLAAPAFAQDVAAPELRAELVERYAADQDVRHRLVERGAFHPDSLQNPSSQTMELLMEMMRVDADNLAFVEGVVAEHGWPSPALVGADGADAVWSIVQHSTLEVQERMLPLVEAAYEAGEVEGSQYALLLDRVLKGRGEPQVYGSQPDVAADGTFSIPATVDDATLDARRAEVGLPPIAEYMAMLAEVYGQPE